MSYMYMMHYIFLGFLFVTQYVATSYKTQKYLTGVIFSPVGSLPAHATSIVGVRGVRACELLSIITYSYILQTYMSKNDWIRTKKCRTVLVLTTVCSL